MNKITEKQIEEKLKTLATLEPSEESAHQMNQCVRRIISDTDQNPTIPHGFFYYAAASAAILLIGIGLLRQTGTIAPSDLPVGPALSVLSQPTPTLAKLNTAFNAGGQQALDDYLKKIESHRQPRAEAITLQDIMTEL